MFYQVDLAILPSRTGGFGLTGLEALSAGLPILVSENSGFGQALSEVPFGSYSLVKSNKASVWSVAIKDVMEKNRELRLKESKALGASYEKEYSWEKQIGELVEKMIKMVRGTFFSMVNSISAIHNCSYLMMWVSSNPTPNTAA